ncbi:type I-B CRISPR-associated protein Cas8b/Csh1 [Clostridium chrysemydis]|uniref:type I-B CRISPR-associated protein Cas8b/Csh1 n=1 Tax=Clostridium chrysemydis TaxID=2665504 RepID=UPI001EE54326|nr:type I-B CRISPR-associated protein Cas8b/Csh1 [Clostridium chrysemydis]
MLNQIIDSIYKNYGNTLEDVILDNYVPTDGTYIIVKPDKNNDLKEFYRTDILFDKNKKDVDRSIEYFKLICKMDYNSRLVDMNKPIDPKKIIQSNNYLSFFVKKESFKNDDKTGKSKLNEERIDAYYEVLKNPFNKYSKKKAAEIYKEVEKDIGEVDLEKLLKIKEWINNNIFDLDLNLKQKNYLKVFFLVDEEDFRREGKRYLAPNIYNNNDYNLKTKKGIVGLPNDNMGLNSKKPYLENKTRCVTTPYLINQSKVLKQKKVFDYLFNLASKRKFNIYLNDFEIKALSDGEILADEFQGFYIRLKKGKEAEIHDFDVISEYSPYLKKKFNFQNILDIESEILYKGKKDKDKWKYEVIKKKKELQELINIIFFNRLLITNYFTEDVPIKEVNLKRALLMSRNQLFNWFHKGDSTCVWQSLNKAMRLCLKNSLGNRYFYKAINQFNLIYSLKEYFEGGEEKMADILMGIRTELKEKILEDKEDYIKNDREYFYAVGQLTSYLLGKSKGKNKPLSLANPIINAKSDLILKKKIFQLYMKYNYDLDLDLDARFKRLYTMVCGYEVEGDIKGDFITAGYLSKKIIYEKKES